MCEKCYLSETFYFKTNYLELFTASGNMSFPACSSDICCYSDWLLETLTSASQLHFLICFHLFVKRSPLSCFLLCAPFVFLLNPLCASPPPSPCSLLLPGLPSISSRGPAGPEVGVWPPSSINPACDQSVPPIMSCRYEKHADYFSTGGGGCSLCSRSINSCLYMDISNCMDTQTHTAFIDM